MNHRIMRTLNLIVIVFLAMTTSAAAQSAAPGPRITPESSPSPSSSSAATEQTGSWSIVDRQDVNVDGQPVAISPDAKWIAGVGPDQDFCVWDVETLDATCDGSDLAVQPETIVWAPDSSAVAFSLMAATYFIDSDIYVFDIEMGTLDDLTDDSFDGPIGFDMDPATGSIPLDIYPAWSPDSSQLLFARSNWNSESMGTALMTMDRHGGDVETLLALTPPEPLIIYSPMYWLADDSILFSVSHSDVDNGQNGIWMRSPSGTLKRVLAGDSTAKVPLPRITSVDAEGTTATVYSVALQVQVPGTSAVYYLLDVPTGDVVDVLPTDGENVTDTLKTDAQVVLLPARLSADDSQIVFAIREGNGQQIAIKDAASGDVTFLPFDETFSETAFIRGLDLVAGDTLFIPTKTDAGTAVILTLASPAATATPTVVPPPCSCAPPPRG